MQPVVVHGEWRVRHSTRREGPVLGAHGQGAVAEAPAGGRRGRFAACGVGGRGRLSLEDLNSREIDLVVREGKDCGGV